MKDRAKGNMDRRQPRERMGREGNGGRGKWTETNG